MFNDEKLIQASLELIYALDHGTPAEINIKKAKLADTVSQVQSTIASDLKAMESVFMSPEKMQ